MVGQSPTWWALFAKVGLRRGSTSCHSAAGTTYPRRSHKLAKKVSKAEKHFQERQQPHNGAMKQEKDDVTQHLEALERLYEPLGELDASAAAARTITDVTALSYASENERRREERWRPSTR
ncbi:conserved hypothetical protein [Trichinella spiralis]|uniref:hypothetical protein n=1 Tax=Trichinella spiralis TaxID=6334 RepID=UPI0001EFDC74|nr:conserved hypothetical protein [Trichinella spiralis]